MKIQFFKEMPEDKMMAEHVFLGTGNVLDCVFFFFFEAIGCQSIQSHMYLRPSGIWLKGKWQKIFEMKFFKFLLYIGPRFRGEKDFEFCFIFAKFIKFFDSSSL
jgi:hypothetical protein